MGQTKLGFMCTGNVPLGYRLTEQFRCRAVDKLFKVLDGLGLNLMLFDHLAWSAVLRSHPAFVELDDLPGSVDGSSNAKGQCPLGNWAVETSSDG